MSSATPARFVCNDAGCGYVVEKWRACNPDAMLQAAFVNGEWKDRAQGMSLFLVYMLTPRGAHDALKVRAGFLEAGLLLFLARFFVLAFGRKACCIDQYFGYD